MVKVGDKAPEIIKTPCCTFHSTHIDYADFKTLARVARSAKALYGWQCHIMRDELKLPTWRLYISEKKLTHQQIEQIGKRQGPVVELRRILNEITGQV